MSENFDVMNSPEAAALLKNKDALKALLQSPDTRKLMRMLSSQNGTQLRQAAEQAKRGDASNLSAMMRSLMESEEGASLVERIETDFSGRT